MKKFILTFAAVLTIVSCKKQESTENTEDANSASINSDSAAVSAENQNVSHALLDSAAIKRKNEILKIQELSDEKKELTEKFAKEADSATKKLLTSEVKLAQEKIDSIKIIASTPKKEVVKPKIITRTKVIYRDLPNQKRVDYKPTITKKGELEIAVDDLENARDIAKEQITKYDGVVKSEQISTNSDNQFDYFQISVPLEKSDYLVSDLENNVGKITSRNIEITGQEYAKNSICNLEITLVNTSQKAAVNSSSKTFGGRTLGAVGSGWNVIEEIFLFLLPFWPLFLIGGGIYYFIKKKKTGLAK